MRHNCKSKSLSIGPQSRISETLGFRIALYFDKAKVVQNFTLSNLTSKKKSTFSHSIAIGDELVLKHNNPAHGFLTTSIRSSGIFRENNPGPAKSFSERTALLLETSNSKSETGGTILISRTWGT